MEMVDPFGWHGVDGPTLHHIRGRLAHLETMTWAEILVRAKKQSHSIKVADICSAAQQRLEALSLMLEDVVSLRLSARERVYGYLENGVLIVLWWDLDQLDVAFEVDSARATSAKRSHAFKSGYKQTDLLSFYLKSR
jgi:hypothetical protein